MHIETGHSLTQDVKILDGVRFVRFVVGGNTAFEVSISEKTASIEVRSVSCVIDGDFLYNDLLSVQPNAANSVTISLRSI